MAIHCNVRRWRLALAVMLTAAVSAATAATYEVEIQQMGTVTGMGTVVFTNDSGAGLFTPDSATLTTNAAFGGEITFEPGTLQVCVRNVDFVDGKVAPGNPDGNHITGAYVEGLAGTLVGDGITLTFSFSPDASDPALECNDSGSSDPADYSKTYTITTARGTSGPFLYHIQNTQTIPEPSTLAIMLGGMAALAVAGMRNRKKKLGVTARGRR